MGVAVRRGIAERMELPPREVLVKTIRPVLGFGTGSDLARAAREGGLGGRGRRRYAKTMSSASDTLPV
jgi:hypothetical protein